MFVLLLDILFRHCIWRLVVVQFRLFLIDPNKSLDSVIGRTTFTSFNINFCHYFNLLQYSPDHMETKYLILEVSCLLSMLFAEYWED